MEGFRIILQINEEKWGHRLIQLVWISTRQFIMWLNRVYGPPPSCIHSLHRLDILLMRGRTVSWEICSETWMIRALVCFLGSLCTDVDVTIHDVPEVLDWIQVWLINRPRKHCHTPTQTESTPPHNSGLLSWKHINTHITYDVLAVPNIKRELRHFSNRRKTWEIVMGNVILFFFTKENPVFKSLSQSSKVCGNRYALTSSTHFQCNWVNDSFYERGRAVMSDLLTAYSLA